MFFKKFFTQKKTHNPEKEKQEIVITPNQCLRLEQKDILCHICVKSCPNDAIDLRKSLKLAHDKCNGCGICIEICPSGVFSFQHAQDKTHISRREFFTKFRNS